MKALNAKTTAELDTDLKAKKSELFNLRFQLATGQLENTAAIKSAARASPASEDDHASARARRRRRKRKEATENG